MTNDNFYTSVAKKATAEITEKKSRFICNMCHAETEKEAHDFIDKIKKEHYDAKHNVYAYIVRDENTSRYSDDGEPQGTAGVPVLDVLKKEGLTDVCVVVTRYFGGILLGGGGLVRAYSHACKLAVDEAVKMIMCECYEVEAECDYSLYGKISHVLPEFEVKVLDTLYENNVRVKMLVKAHLFSALCEKLTDLCNGNIKLEHSEITNDDFA